VGVYLIKLHGKKWILVFYTPSMHIFSSLLLLFLCILSKLFLFPSLADLAPNAPFFQLYPAPYGTYTPLNDIIYSLPRWVPLPLVSSRTTRKSWESNSAASFSDAKDIKLSLLCARDTCQMTQTLTIEVLSGTLALGAWTLYRGTNTTARNQIEKEVIQTLLSHATENILHINATVSIPNFCQTTSSARERKGYSNPEAIIILIRPLPGSVYHFSINKPL
jgi:hypothetical protein